MKTEVINRVAEIIRNPSTANKSKVQKERESTADSVELSAGAQKLAESSQEVSGEYDRQRAEKVSRLEQLAKSGQYQMNDEMVDQIAERIIETL